MRQKLWGIIQIKINYFFSLKFLNLLQYYRRKVVEMSNNGTFIRLKQERVDETRKEYQNVLISREYIQQESQAQRKQQYTYKLTKSSQTNKGNFRQMKIDAPLRKHQDEQNLSSPINSSEIPSTTPPPQNMQTQSIPSHLNPCYSLPEDEGGIFNYLMMYSYSEGQKKLQKQYKDWTQLEQIQSQKLNIIKSEGPSAIAKDLHQKYKQMKERIREPFDKAHKQFNQHISKYHKQKE